MRRLDEGRAAATLAGGSPHLRVRQCWRPRQQAMPCEIESVTTTACNWESFHGAEVGPTPACWPVAEAAEVYARRGHLQQFGQAVSVEAKVHLTVSQLLSAYITSAATAP